MRKPTAKTSTAKISRASSTAKTRQTSTRATAPRAPISPEHRLDIIGIILMAAGVILLLTLLTFVQGAKSETPHLFLQWFGWGAYLLPLLLIVVGFWLLLSKIERFPAISTERVLGIMLLFSNLLGWFAFIAGGNASRASGGGAAGSALAKALTQALGEQVLPGREAQDDTTKALLRSNTDEAAALGVFGVPAFEVDGKVFWGLDSLPMLRAYLSGDTWFDSQWDTLASVAKGIRS